MCYQIIIIYLIYFIFIEFRVVGRLIHLQLSVCIAKQPADARQKKHDQNKNIIQSTMLILDQFLMHQITVITDCCHQTSAKITELINWPDLCLINANRSHNSLTATCSCYNKGLFRNSYKKCALRAARLECVHSAYNPLL